MMLKLAVLAVLCWCMLFLANEAVAEERDEVSQDRMLQLEAEVADLKSEVEELRSGAPKTSDQSFPFSDTLSFSGLVEVEAFYEDGEDEETSDLVLATFELGVAAAVHKHVNVEVVMLWEEDDTEPMDLDTGTVTIGNFRELPLTLTAGKLYPAFGNFNSYFITSPLTKKLGEIRESALQVEADLGIANISASVFNGDVDEEGDGDHLDNFVLAASTSPMEVLELGVSYLSNIADSDELEGEFETGITAKVGGFSAYAVFAADLGEATLEYMTALDAFEDADLDFDENGVGDEPKALNIEFALNVTDDLQAAVRYGTSDEFLDYPETTYGAAASYAAFENTTVALEVLRNEYVVTQEDLVVTAQLGVQF